MHDFLITLLRSKWTPWFAGALWVAALALPIDGFSLNGVPLRMCQFREFTGIPCPRAD